jgi:uncharacterized membrane protein (DUF485 family)
MQARSFVSRTFTPAGSFFPWGRTVFVDSTPTFASVPQRAAQESRWEAIESDPELQQLLAEKRRFIVPATIFFIAYYFALPILVGYFPDVMSKKVIGNINLAYLFAVSEFVMTGVIVALYVQRAKHWDVLADHIKAKLEAKGQR